MKYITKPVIVEATKISALPISKGDGAWVLKLDTDKTHVVPGELVGSREPVIGDYYVVDGETGRVWVESASEFIRKYEAAQ